MLHTGLLRVIFLFYLFRPGFCSTGLPHRSQTDDAVFAARLYRLQKGLTVLMNLQHQKSGAATEQSGYKRLEWLHWDSL